MNFIKFSFIIRVFFFTGFIFGAWSPNAEGTDLVLEKQTIRLNFPVPDYYLSNEIIDYCFDQKGTLFISSENRIGIFHGKKWQFLNLQGNSKLSVSSNGNVFLANKSEVFQLKLDSALNYSIESLFLLNEGEKIYQIVNSNNELLVSNGKKILKYHNGELIELASDSDRVGIFKTNSRLIIQAGKKIANYSLVNGLGNFVELNYDISFLSDHPNGFLLYSSDSKRFIVLSPSFDEASYFTLPFSSIKGILQITENNFVCLANTNKVIFFNSIGKIFDNKNLQNVSDNSKLLRSPYGRVWLNTGKDFEVFDRKPIIEKIDIAENSGKIEWLEVYEGQFALAGESGLYLNGSINPISTYPFQYIKNANFGLLGLSEGQLYAIINEELIPLQSKCTKFQWDEMQDKLYLLKEGKLHRIDLSNSINGNSIPVPFESEIIDFCCDKGILVVLTNKGLYYNDLNTSKYHELHLPKGLNSLGIRNLKLIGKSLYINSNSGIYRFQDLKIPGKIAEYITSSEHYLPVYNSDFYALIDGYNLKWFGENTEESFYFTSEMATNYSLKGLYKWGPKTMIINGGENLFYFTATDPSSSFPLSIHIQNLFINGKLKFSGSDFESARIALRKDLNSIRFKDNMVELEFTSSDFFSSSNHYYYELSFGDNVDKSNIVEGRNLKLENLRPGNFRLSLIVINDAGIESEPLLLTFKIKAPFYLSTLAKIIYLVLFSIGLFVAYRIYMFRKHRVEDKQESKVKVEAYHKAVPEEEEKVNKPDFKSNINDGERKKKWDKYTMVTVLFSDIQGFTKIAESMNPENLIDELDQFFFHFDSVVDNYDIEKIKTIGDAYMAAGGIPRANSTNPVEVVLAALEMQQYMKQLKRTKIDFWDLRIGIHTGPVIAGKIGSKKRAYDIWGDSVNIASRMESSGEAGKVNVSGETYSLIKEFFLCEYRGKIPVKYKGNLDMYFVKGLRPELSINLVGLPNRKFFLKLQLNRISDLEDYVFDKLQNELPKGMFFHNAEYTRQVYDHAYLLAKSENLDPEESLLVRTAALLMNIGYLTNYKNPESESAEISRSILEDFKYSEKQINSISNLILSTKKPLEPQNVMEMILADASMHYLGRSDYLRIYKLLFLEENELGVSMNPKNWKIKQIKIIKEFKFYTAAARRLCEVPLSQQIQNIETDKL